MSPSLFSHAAEEPQPSKILKPITFEVTVPHPPEQAFEGFTDLIHLWWPVDTHSVFGGGAHVEFEETVLTETSDRDEVRSWGDILEWEPGRLLSLTWHPGAGPLTATRLEVRFTAEGQSTIVRLRHSGWDQAADGAERRLKYQQDWPSVLSKYARFMGAIAE